MIEKPQAIIREKADEIEAKVATIKGKAASRKQCNEIKDRVEIIKKSQAITREQADEIKAQSARRKLLSKMVK